MLSTKRDMPSITQIGVANSYSKNIKKIDKEETMASACDVLDIVIAVGTALKGACKND